jgi:hypothetical protein
MMVALPAVLELLKALEPLVVIVALPAVLVLLNVRPLLLMILGAFEELLTMPAPLNVRVDVRVNE